MHIQIIGTVRQYVYRTASVGDIFLSLPHDTLEDLEHQLAEAAGLRTDNHTVYEIVQDGMPPVYIAFSDSTAEFGHSIRKERW